MAESVVRGTWSVKVPCRYFANGVCREGERCLYLHEETNNCSNISSENQDDVENKIDPVNRSLDTCAMDSSGSSNNCVVSNISDNTSSDIDTGSIICHYFLQGRCMYGSKCHYSHDDKLNESKAEDSSQDDVATGTSSSTSSGDQVSASAIPSASLTPTSIQDDEESRPEESTSIPISKSSLKVPDAETWVNAPEFIPSSMMFNTPCEETASEENEAVDESACAAKSWAQVVNSTAGTGLLSADVKLCPYAEMGDCPYAERCTYLHGDICDLCGLACLHPYDEDQRKSHTDDCIKQHERDMELSFAIARSKDKQCGVCFEVVVDKNPASEQRFGILPNCNHCFCLACIRKWRQAKQFEKGIIRACPECRVTSDYVCPSMYWVDTKEEKEKLILAYKDALSNKQCKYFKQGQGKCPFGNKCFYLHAYPDGTKVDTGPPIRRHRQNANGEFDVLQQLYLWDFLEERENRWLTSLDDLEDLVAFLTDSEEEMSEYEFL